MVVRCGNPIHEEQVADEHHHANVAEVRSCFLTAPVVSIEEADYDEDQRAQQAGELWAENAWLRAAENSGWEEAELDARMEAARGVIPFGEL